MCYFLYYSLLLIALFSASLYRAKSDATFCATNSATDQKKYLKKYILKFSILSCGIISNNLVELILEVSECNKNVR